MPDPSTTRARWPPPNRPFAPGRWPFYYGWVVLALGTLAVGFSIPGQTMGVSVFTDSLLEATGLSRLQFSTTYLFGTLASGFLLPLGGRVLDLLGARLVGAGAALLLAVTLVSLSFFGQITPTLGDDPTAAETFTVLALMTFGFAVLRFSGQGMLTLTGRTMVARWFDRRRGLVAAISGAFVSFAFSLAPTLLLIWITASGWRGAWRQMAIALGLLSLVALLFFRDTPEECGLELDGGSGAGADLDEEPIPSDSAGKESRRPDATRAQALRSRAFWVLTLVIAAQSMIGTALTFHIVDLGAENGLPESLAVKIFVPISVISVSLGFVVGWLVDRQPILRLVRFMALSEAVMFATAGHLDDPVLRWVAIGAWGCVGGCYGPLTVAALPRLFGRLHLGAISGTMTMVLILASALGPAYLAWFRDMTATYRIGLYLSAALPLALFTASFMVRRRGRPVAG